MNMDEKIAALRLLLDDALASPKDQPLDNLIGDCVPAVDYAVSIGLLDETETHQLNATPDMFLLITHTIKTDVELAGRLCEWAAGVVTRF